MGRTLKCETHIPVVGHAASHLVSNLTVVVVECNTLLAVVLKKKLVTKTTIS